jgi:hypothetical protein
LTDFTGTFGSGDPFIFTDADGDQLVTYYGRTDFGAAGPGTFSLLPADQHPDGLPFEQGDVYAYWIAEFVIQPESTGKYANLSGSWIMDAFSDPFSPDLLSPEGLNEPLGYRWESRDSSSIIVNAVTQQPDVSIQRSSFRQNSAVAAAGYIDGVGFSGLAAGGAVLNVTGSMHVDRSTFYDNSATGGSGAAPGSTSGGGAYGGAINSGNASPFGIANSSLTVSRSTFVRNSVNGGNGDVSRLNGGPAGGGAIAGGNGTTMTIQKSNFSDNSATGGNGGTDAAAGTGTGGAVQTSGGATAALSRNHFHRNTAMGGDGASGRGGALGIDTVALAGFFPGSANVTVNHDKFYNNVAYGGIGGGIYNEGDLTLQHATLSHNAAVGLPTATIDFVPGYLFTGTALGGGVSSSGNVDVSHSWFIGNRAVGADGATGLNILTVSPDSNPIPTYPGTAVGGGLHSVSTASVTHSKFAYNAALGGDNNSGTFAGVANGGGIYNDGEMSIHHSHVHHNRAVGGDNNTGDINPGLGTGGGIASGSVAALAQVRSASLTVSTTHVASNVAKGGAGNANLPVVPVPEAHQAGNGTAGGILVYQGTVDISNSQVLGNRAVGGPGGSAGGGGIYFYDFVGGVIANVSHTRVIGNAAIGGRGDRAVGGGIASGSDSIFGAGGEVTVTHSVIAANRAVGGRRDGAAPGGDGLGGGIYVDTNSALKLNRSRVFANRAVGRAGGDGIGGGLYNIGDIDLLTTLVFANFATTSDNNCFGC